MSDTERVRIVDLPEATKLDESMSFASDSKDGSGTRKVPYSMLKETIQQAGAENLAEEYDAEKTYKVGELCTYKGIMYECTTEVTTPEAFAEGKWAAANMGGKLDEVKEELTGLGLSVVDGTLCATYEEE